MEYVPKISVVVPVFNSEATLERSIGSLLGQISVDLEVIAVNDGSTDNSALVLDKIKENEPRLTVVHLSQNVGAHEARIAGLKLVNNPYVGFVDADDFVKADMYKIMLTACLEHDADIAICGIDLFSEEGRKIGVKLAFEKNKVESKDIFKKFCMLEYGTGSLCNKIFKRKLLLQHALKSFHWRQDSSEDTLVNIGCFMGAQRVILLKNKLYGYVVNPGSTTRKYDITTCFVRIFRAYAVAIDLYKEYGREVLEAITELYGRQFMYSCYRVNDQSELVFYEDDLSEAVMLIAKQYPIGLVAISNSGWISERKTNIIGRGKFFLSNLFYRLFR